MIYFTFSKVLGRYKNLMCQKDTELVIEGFPRSANTFFVDAIKISLELMHAKPIKIAHHMHSIAQIKFGLKHNIPIVVLVRNPLDAISSYVIRNDISVKSGIEEYIYFYRYIHKVKDRIILAKFEEVIKNYAQIIEMINRKYDQNYPVLKNDEIEKQVFNKIEDRDYKKFGQHQEKYAIPSNKKNKIKENIILSLKEHSKYPKSEELFQLLIQP